MQQCLMFVAFANNRNNNHSHNLMFSLMINGYVVVHDINALVELQRIDLSAKEWRCLSLHGTSSSSSSGSSSVTTMMMAFGCPSGGVDIWDITITTPATTTTHPTEETPTATATPTLTWTKRAEFHAGPQHNGTVLQICWCPAATIDFILK